MRKCVVCGQAESSTIWLHNFPNNPKRNADWKKAMNMKEGDFFPHSRICCRHFTVESYVYAGSKYLNRNAVPSLYPLTCHKKDNSSISIGLNPIPDTNISVQKDQYSVVPSIEETTFLQTLLSNNPDITTMPVASLSYSNRSISHRSNGKRRTFKRFKTSMIRKTLRTRRVKNRKQLLISSGKQMFHKYDKATWKRSHNSFDGEKKNVSDQITKNIRNKNTSISTAVTCNDVEEMIPKNIIVTVLPLNDTDNALSQDILTLPSVTINEKMGHNVKQVLLTSSDLASKPSAVISNDLKCNLDLECWVEDLEPCQLAFYKNRTQTEELLQNQMNDLVKTCQYDLIGKYEYITAIEVFETQNIIKAMRSENIQLPRDCLLNKNNVNMTKYTHANPLSCIESVSPIQKDKHKNNCSVKFKEIRSDKPYFTNSEKKISLNRLKEYASDKKVRNVMQTLTRYSLNKKQFVQSPIISLPRESEGSVNVLPTSKSHIFQRSSLALSINKTYFRKSMKKTATISSNILPKTIEENLSIQTQKVYGNAINTVGQSSLILVDRSCIEPMSIVASPYLRTNNSYDDRAKLESKIRDALTYKPAELIDWLMNLGLIKSQQSCGMHCSNYLTLTMDSDPTKFPNSGGYIWTSKCCPQKMTSIFSGSIFETAPHPPGIVLKLLYYWACQTDINEVSKLVDVSHVYIKGMYTWIRAVCTIATFSHIRMLGGCDSLVEVGLICLETAEEDDGKYFKVEVLGILERTSKLIRLKAFEFNTERDRTIKCIQVLQPLENWVHINSTIAIDHSLVKNALHFYGYTNVIRSENENNNIMEYLRKVVSKVFQSTLSLLSLQIFQQFLDELVWREWFGTTSAQAFDNLVAHIAEQTRYTFGPSLIIRLNRVASNPFKITFPKKNVASVRSSVNQFDIATPKKIETEELNQKRSLREEQSARCNKNILYNASNNKSCDICFCGYSNDDYNKEAKHLTECENSQ